MKKLLTSIIIFILTFHLLPVPMQGSTAEPIMTVKLRNYLGNQTQISLKSTAEYKSSDGKFKLASGVEYKLKLEQYSSDTLKLVLYKDSTKVAVADSFAILPSSASDLLYINNRPYKGSFQFVQETINSKKYIRPINSINMEDYLKGVVPKEMHASWQSRSIKITGSRSQNLCT